MTVSKARRQVRTVLTTLLVLYLTLLAGTPFTNVLLWPRVIQQIILAALFGGWLLSLAIQRRPFPATPLDRPILVYLAVYLLASIFAVDPRVSLEALWLMGTHALLFYLLVDRMRAWGPEAILKPLMFTLSVVILVSLMQEITWYFGVGLFMQRWPEIGGLRDPFPPVLLRYGIGPVGAQSISNIIATWTPIALAWMVTTQKQQTRQMLVVWLLGAVGVVVITFSRGAFLSLAVSLPALAFLIIAGNSRWQDRIQAWFSTWRGRSLGVLLIAVAVVGISLGVVRLGQVRDTVTGGYSQSGDEVRLDLWRSAWEIGLRRPLLGAGEYSFGRELRTVRDPTITDDYLIVPDNFPLLVWAEAGLAGILVMLWLVGMVGWVAYRRWRAASGPQRLRIAGIAAGLLGFAAHNIVDQFAITPCMLSAFALVAYLVIPQNQEKKPVRPVRLALPPILAGLLLVSLIPLSISDYAYYFGTQANASEAVGDLNSALSAIDTARRLDPALGLYDAQRARYLGALALQGQADINQALAAYQAALRREDTYDAIHANYAVLLRHAGRLEEAYSEMEHALEIYPLDRRYYLWAGEYAENAGIDERARQHYREALQEVPYWAVSPFWEETALRASVRTEFLSGEGLGAIPLADLRAMPGECWPLLVGRQPESPWAPPRMCAAWVALAVQGDPAGALRLLDQSRWMAGSDLYYLRAEAAFALGDATQSDLEARTALFLNDKRGYLVLGRLAEARGDFAAAADFYSRDMPTFGTRQAWSYAVYGRKDAFYLPLELSAPSFGPDDLAAGLALARMYLEQGDQQKANAVYDALRLYDSYLVVEDR